MIPIAVQHCSLGETVAFLQRRELCGLSVGCFPQTVKHMDCQRAKDAKHARQLAVLKLRAGCEVSPQMQHECFEGYQLAKRRA